MVISSEPYPKSRSSLTAIRTLRRLRGIDAGKPNGSPTPALTNGQSIAIAN